MLVAPSKMGSSHRMVEKAGDRFVPKQASEVETALLPPQGMVATRWLKRWQTTRVRALFYSGSDCDRICLVRCRIV